MCTVLPPAVDIHIDRDLWTRNYIKSLNFKQLQAHITSVGHSYQNKRKGDMTAELLAMVPSDDSEEQVDTENESDDSEVRVGTLKMRPFKALCGTQLSVSNDQLRLCHGAVHSSGHI